MYIVHDMYSTRVRHSSILVCGQKTSFSIYIISNDIMRIRTHITSHMLLLYKIYHVRITWWYWITTQWPDWLLAEKSMSRNFCKRYPRYWTPNGKLSNILLKQYIAVATDKTEYLIRGNAYSPTGVRNMTPLEYCVTFLSRREPLKKLIFQK